VPQALVDFELDNKNLGVTAIRQSQSQVTFHYFKVQIVFSQGLHWGEQKPMSPPPA
jgi:hypothetical protein